MFGSSFASRRILGCLASAVLCAALIPGPAGATPVCPDDKTMCGGRIFPEPDTTLDFVQFSNGEYTDGILALEDQYPKFVKVSTLDKLLNDDKAVSFDGHPIHVVEITNFGVPERRKLPVMVSLSVHGHERAGLEGGVRYMEDLATWAKEDPDHKLKNGTDKDSISVPVSQVLKKVHLYLANINPDGWVAGDDPDNTYNRGNGNGVDLNREFPTMGWVFRGYTPLSEPESKSWHRFVKRIDPVVTADLHGELTSANNAFADIMLPAGQWNPKEQSQEERLARHMTSNIERYFDEDGVVLGDITGAGGAMTPAEYATGYDVVGYDDSGFMGDYFTQRGAVDMDVEHFLSHLVPNGFWSPPLEDAHVAAVRGEIETMIVEAMVTRSVKANLSLGRTGYLFDPTKKTSKDGYGGPPPPKGYDPEPYSATRMRYFKDLSNFTNTPLRRVLSADVKKDGLKGLDTFIITQKVFPKDPRGRPAVKTKTTKRLRQWVSNGGNLILTDRALRFLVRLGVVKKSALARSRHNAGHVNIDDFEDPYTKKVHVTASQTYYEVPLGFPPENTAPHWTVAKAAWEEAGGKSIAHVGDDEERIGLGRLKLGKGTVGIIGALLPKQTEKYDHFYGLADYGVTVAGGQILNNMVAFGRS